VLVEAERGALGDQDIAAGDGIGEGPRSLRVMAVEPMSPVKASTPSLVVTR
jgi:hypothetical protein